MDRILRIALMLAPLLATAPGMPFPAFAAEDGTMARDDRIAELERKLDLVTDELARVRDQVAVPEEPELKSQYGLGPAASKIYGVERGLSIGGYGEFFYTNFLNSHEGSSATSDRQLDRADNLRLVMYMGYKFTDKIVFNSEIEFEHARAGSSTASAGSGTVSVEFAALDFFHNDYVNGRAGLLLLPMGFYNEVHEPPFFNGVQRAETERRIIPSTWREMGAGVFGKLHETVEYRAYLTTGFNVLGFSDAGVRGGRQYGNRALAENLAVVGRLDWTPLPGLMVGGSAYRGGSGQDQTLGGVGGVDVPDSTLTLWELHAQYEYEQFFARALFAHSQLSNARDLNDILGRPIDKPIADRQLGGYVELAYDIWPTLTDGFEKSLSPFIRVEYVDTQNKVPDGYIANEKNTYWLFTPGITFKPHPNVALKLEYRNFQTVGDVDRPDEISLGMGFAF